MYAIFENEVNLARISQAIACLPQPLNHSMVEITVNFQASPETFSSSPN
jgi:hypothetical protein